MTSLLRLMGASIMGILDPIPSTVPSPVTEDEAAWIRANAWPKALRRIENAYPHGFFRWCSCERGTCHPCATGRHDQCDSADGPRADEDAGTITDRHGFVVAVVQHGPAQRPCRRVCPCTHPAVETAVTSARQERPPGRRTPPSSGWPAAAEGQLSLFTGACP
ncbi:DUF6248 family natural product biosynthesis protein [Streptomyces sp. NPDC088175]|uniref:DUF6248 family natural product biosynthesis protein n=1 Tax=unclassified Streptomyces TaxID=2593676 RepID=UPI0038214ED1